MTICRAESRPCLGYYYLDRKIGSGNYAIVRLAEHRITGTKVNTHTHDTHMTRTYHTHDTHMTHTHTWYTHTHDSHMTHT